MAARKNNETETVRRVAGKAESMSTGLTFAMDNRVCTSPARRARHAVIHQTESNLRVLDVKTNEVAYR